MDLSKLRTLPRDQLERMAEMCDLDTKLPTSDLVRQLSKIFKGVEERKARYTRVEQLGVKGKEGTVFLVKDRSGHEYAMKTFSAAKSDRNLEREAVLLGKAAEFGIAPALIEYDTGENYIVMEKLETSLFDYMKAHGGKLSNAMQQELIRLFKKLDSIEIFHADPSPLNFMLDKEGKIRAIDFGFAKHIDDKVIKEHGTSRVNMKFMPVGFILKMRGLVEPSSLGTLLRYVSPEDRARLGL